MERQCPSITYLGLYSKLVVLYILLNYPDEPQIVLYLDTDELTKSRQNQVVEILFHANLWQVEV